MPDGLRAGAAATPTPPPASTDRGAIDGHSRLFAAMACECEVAAFAGEAAALRRAIDAAVAEVQRIERKFSRYRDDSVVARINAAAGGPAVELDPETAALVDYAAACFEQSEGLFDATSGVLRRAWDFRRPRIPREDDVRALLGLVGWDKVEWRRPWLRLTRPGMELDFGGFGKEYAADRAAATLVALGVAHGLVNLGGDVRVVGGHPDGRPWRVGVRHPREPGVAIAMVELRDAALATSGDYERYFELDGRRYCHILDPRSGRPAHGARSVSVVSPLAIVAGTHATVAMLHGTSAPAYLDRQNVPHLVVREDGSTAGTLALAA